MPPLIIREAASEAAPADHVAAATGDGIDKRTGVAVIGGSIPLKPVGGTPSTGNP
jgi:hypothetical protein